MVSPRNAASLLGAVLLSAAVAAASDDRPNFVGTVRVKQHYHRSGELVEGEEDLLKVIVKWDPIPGAEAYELCHDCGHIDEATGLEDGELDGAMYPIEVGHTCGGQPCHVMPGIKQGHNRFHLRVKKGGEFGPWSKYQNFETVQPGNVGHTEL